MVAGGAACRRCKAVTGPLKADVSTGWLSRRPTAAKWRIVCGFDRKFTVIMKM
jgi:hypothetical protein